jgi:hypothetical protein
MTEILHHATVVFFVTSTVEFLFQTQVLHLATEVFHQSYSSDETWTSSIDGEDSDDDNVDDDGTSWQVTPVQYKDFSISFNKVDTDLERGYFEEVKELRKRVLREFDTLSSENTKRKSSLNANEVMNAVYNTDILFSVLTF